MELGYDDERIGTIRRESNGVKIRNGIRGRKLNTNVAEGNHLCGTYYVLWISILDLVCDGW